MTDGMSRQNFLACRRRYEWRRANRELNSLHAEAFAHPILDIDWISQVKAYSLGWVTARDDGELIRFVNVPWDGAIHAFILDTIVSPRKTDRASARNSLRSRPLRRVLLDVSGFTSILTMSFGPSIWMPAVSSQRRISLLSQLVRDNEVGREIIQSHLQEARLHDDPLTNRFERSDYEHRKRETNSRNDR
jgi:hypothetical protein